MGIRLQMTKGFDKLVLKDCSILLNWDYSKQCTIATPANRSKGFLVIDSYWTWTPTLDNWRQISMLLMETPAIIRMSIN